MLICETDCIQLLQLLFNIIKLLHKIRGQSSTLKPNYNFVSIRKDKETLFFRLFGDLLDFVTTISKEYKSLFR